MCLVSCRCTLAPARVIRSQDNSASSGTTTDRKSSSSCRVPQELAVCARQRALAICVTVHFSNAYMRWTTCTSIVDGST